MAGVHTERSAITGTCWGDDDSNMSTCGTDMCTPPSPSPLTRARRGESSLLTCHLCVVQFNTFGIYYIILEV